MRCVGVGRGVCPVDVEVENVKDAGGFRCDRGGHSCLHSNQE